MSEMSMVKDVWDYLRGRTRNDYIRENLLVVAQNMKEYSFRWFGYVQGQATIPVRQLKGYISKKLWDGRELKILGVLVRKDMLSYQGIESKLLNWVEWKSKTCIGNPKLSFIDMGTGKGTDTGIEDTTLHYWQSKTGIGYGFSNFLFRLLLNEWNYYYLCFYLMFFYVEK